MKMIINVRGLVLSGVKPQVPAKPVKVIRSLGLINLLLTMGKKN